MTKTRVSKQSIRSVMCWAQRQSLVRQKHRFRTAELIASTTTNEYNRIFGSSTFSKDEVVVCVRRVIENRTNLIQKLIGDDNSLDICDGRILRHNFEETTYTCTPKEQTNGFFDELDLPPWDLWLGLSIDGESEILLSWIPTEFIALADAGVQSSAEENILWVEDFIMTT